MSKKFPQHEEITIVVEALPEAEYDPNKIDNQ
jgi:hypothetical protein